MTDPFDAKAAEIVAGYTNTLSDLEAFGASEWTVMFRGDIAAALRQLAADKDAEQARAVAEAVPYRTILSAPKDGTPIILLWWDEYNQMWRFKRSWWRKYCDGYGEGWGIDFHPEYWLPEPLRTIPADPPASPEPTE